jgi:ABC-type glycerol-3-phosphate transport system permease component
MLVAPLARRSQIKARVIRVVGKTLVYFLLISLSIIFALPFFWMISTSLKPDNEVLAFPPQWLPTHFEIKSYIEVWQVLPFAIFLRNSIIVTFSNLIGNLVSCSLVAFAFARLRARLRDILFVLMLSTMMIPHEVTLIPQFILFSKFGWLDTLLPLMIPAWFGWPFFIFILRQFFMTIPLELDDAARVDGCSTFRLFWQILLPLIKPALATVAIFAFVGNWNNFVGPLIYLQSYDNYTLALGLRLFQAQYTAQVRYNLVMAATLMMLLPIIVLFLLTQKYFVRSIITTGLKG